MNFTFSFVSSADNGAPKDVVEFQFEENPFSNMQIMWQ
jgi:hypothetical protein